jgi:hypothetical protein
LAAATKPAQSSPTLQHWFTEGFDTADLREAKATLDRSARRNAPLAGLNFFFWEMPNLL